MTLPYLDIVRREAAAMADAARLGLEPTCPSCPDWTVQQLVEHTGIVHRWVTEIVRRRATERVKRSELPPPPDDPAEIVPWFEQGAAVLVDMLATTPDDEPTWNWSVSQPHKLGFWKRRMAHETVVHRWDAQCAHGVVTPVEAALAVDGIAEMMDTVLPSRLSGNEARPSLGGTLHVHCTDAEGEWLVKIVEGEATVRPEHAKGDCAVRGPASDLLLYLYGRIDGADTIERFGDEAVFANWLELSRFG
ncbi:MAG TPA: maleylpyruvate isomerase family mycothiol-dependent enzyme [Acidimicrobiales bacterium]|nr:maleylpyruvate isomerase family mycothiol-dependent enzyme [Acidimicrobiales bacterium]